MNMRDEVREQIDTILENFYYSDGNSADYQEATDHILSLNAIAIVDREAELPECPYAHYPDEMGSKHIIEENRIRQEGPIEWRCHACLWLDGQESILNAGWIKKLK